MEIKNLLPNGNGINGILPVDRDGISHRTVLFGTRGSFLFPLFVSQEQYELFNVCNEVKT